MGINHVLDNYIKDQTLRFSINKAKVLPFNTRNYRVTYKNGFNGIIGEIARMIEGYELKDISLSDELDLMILNHEIEIKDEDRIVFNQIIENFDPQKTNSNHKNINLFKFNPLSSSRAVLGVDEITKRNMEENRKEIDISEYIFHIIFNENDDLKHFFDSNHKNDVLTKLYERIYGGNKIATSRKISNIKSFGLLDEVIREDLNFITRNEIFFLEYFDKFVSFYYFVYCVQVIFEMDVLTHSDTRITPVYWLLDTEKASPNRKAVIEGWKYLRTNVGKRMWVNNIVLDIINLIVDSEYISLNEFYTQEQSDEIEVIYNEFNKVIRSNKSYVSTSDTKMAVKQLYDLLSVYYDSESTRQGTQSRFTLWIEELGKKFFLKQRRQYGMILNLSEEYLVFLISIIIKEERIKLSTLFDELERRTVFLDNKSKKEVISILNKQGLLEKKSDSGDAQYIRRLVR